MEENRSKSRKSVRTLVNILLALLCIIFLVVFVFLKKQETEKNDHLFLLNNNINEVNNVISEQKDQIDNLENQIKELNDIDETIVKTRESFVNQAIALEEKIKNGESNNKIAYLTFDDGPYRLTEQFLDILDEYDVKGTFFCLKKNEEYGYYPENVEVYNRVINRIINSGHVLGNHTASHALGRNGIYSSLDAFVNSVIENRNYIQNEFSYNTTVFRFPGGSGTAGQLYGPISEELRKLGYCWVNWNSMTGDGNGPTAVSVEESISNVLDKTGNNKFLVVLMHDYSNNTLKALPNIIEGLRSQGYSFLPLFNGSQAVFD